MANTKNLTDSIITALVIIVCIVIAALSVHTILGNTIFSTLNIINTTEISSEFGAFVSNLIAFLAIVGTIIGVIWLVYYVRRLFDKEGLQNISA